MSNSQDIDLHELQRTTNAAREKLEKQEAQQRESHFHNMIDKIKLKIWDAAKQGKNTADIYDITEKEVRALPNDLIEARQSGEKLLGMALDVFRWCQGQSLNPEIDYWRDEGLCFGQHYIRVHW